MIWVVSFLTCARQIPCPGREIDCQYTLQNKRVDRGSPQSERSRDYALELCQQRTIDNNHQFHQRRPEHARGASRPVGPLVGKPWWMTRSRCGCRIAIKCVPARKPGCGRGRLIRHRRALPGANRTSPAAAHAYVWSRRPVDAGRTLPSGSIVLRPSGTNVGIVGGGGRGRQKGRMGDRLDPARWSGRLYQRATCATRIVCSEHASQWQATAVGEFPGPDASAHVLLLARAPADVQGEALADRQYVSRSRPRASPSRLFGEVTTIRPKNGFAGPWSGELLLASAENDDEQFRIRYQSRSKTIARMLEQLESAPERRSSERRVED